MIPEIPHPAQQAHIRVQECIGCTKCLPACPVDAIAGGAKALHVVLATYCIGCGLCVAPCPVDCIDMIPSEFTPDAALAQQRHNTQAERFNILALQRQAQQKARAISQKQREIQDAVARVKLRKQAIKHETQQN